MQIPVGPAPNTQDLARARGHFYGSAARVVTVYHTFHAIYEVIFLIDVLRNEQLHSNEDGHVQELELRFLLILSSKNPPKVYDPFGAS